MYTDENGIAFYEGTDPVSPLHTLLNSGQSSVAQAIKSITDELNNPGWAWRMAAGTTGVSINNAYDGSVEFPLPEGRFTEVPLLLGSIRPAGSAVVVAGCNAISRTLGRIYVRWLGSSPTTRDVGINWFAIQMTPTSASG